MHLDMRHDVAIMLESKLDEKVIKAISGDFTNLKFNCHY